jgi:hypothetical protein
MAVKTSPFSLIGSIMTIAAVIGLAFAVERHFVSDAEAADQMRQTNEQIQAVSARQQYDRIQTDLAVIEIDIEYQEEKLERKPDNKEIKKKIEKLKRRQAVLEKAAIEYETAK